MLHDEVLIHNNIWKKSDIRESIEYAKDIDLFRQKFVAHDKYTHDHCEICFWTIFETNLSDSGYSYTSGSVHICIECYNQFLDL